MADQIKDFMTELRPFAKVALGFEKGDLVSGIDEKTLELLAIRFTDVCRCCYGGDMLSQGRLVATKTPVPDETCTSPMSSCKSPRPFCNTGAA